MPGLLDGLDLYAWSFAFHNNEIYSQVPKAPVGLPEEKKDEELEEGKQEGG